MSMQPSLPLESPSATHLLPTHLQGFAHFLDEWLATASAELVQAAHYAALPLRLDRTLFSLLLGEESQADTLLVELKQRGLLTEDGRGGYRFQPVLRELLVRRWQQRDLPTYRRTSQLAADFYRTKLPGSESDQVEFVYHQLGAANRAGVDALTDAFEQAWVTHHLGLGERLLRYAKQQQAVLGEEARQWLQYFQARIDAAYYRYQESEGALTVLCTAQIAPGLRALALQSLADTLVCTQRWSDAFDRYVEAERVFRQLGDPYRLALSLEAEANAYLLFATNLGGLPESTQKLASPPQSWLFRFTHAPFLAYRWFSRRSTRLPNLYFGTNYQDWIIYRYLYEAIDRFEKALSELTSLSTTSGLPIAELRADIHIQLADLYHSVGRWASGERLLNQLENDPVVSADNYRHATFLLACGRADLAHARLKLARNHLQSALESYEHYRDQRAIAITSRLLAQIEIAEHKPDDAVAAYTHSLEASLVSNDLLAATDTWLGLNGLASQSRLATESRAQVTVYEGRVERRAYIARFVGPLHHRFSLLAVWVGLPLLYFVVSIMKYVLGISVLLLETSYQAMLTRINITAELLGAFLIIIAITCWLIWTYELLYVWAGWLFVRRLRLDDLAHHQPKYVTTLREGITVRDETGHLQEFTWQALTSYVTMNRSIWSTPLALFSHIQLAHKAVTVTLDGILSHYQDLQAEVDRHLAAATGAARTKLDYSFLRSYGSLLALILTLIFIPISIFDWLGQTCKEVHVDALITRAESNAFVLDQKGDLWVIDTWKSSSTRESLFLDLKGDATALSLSGRYLYVAAGTAGLIVLDVSQPYAPLQISILDTPGSAQAVAIAEPYAYVADGEAGLIIIDVSRPALPVRIGSTDTLGFISDVATLDDHAYLADRDSGLRVVNITDPTLPRGIATLALSGEATAIAVAANRAYLASGSGGLHVIDISTPSAPIESAMLAMPGAAMDVTLAGSYAYVAAARGGLQVVYIWNPDQPILKTSFGTQGETVAVAESAKSAYIADSGGGLRVLDVQNPCKSIKEKMSFSQMHDARNVTIREPHTLWLTAILFEFLWWGYLFFPLAGLLHLLYHRFQVHQRLKSDFSWRSELPLLIGVVILFIALWNALVALMK